MNKQIAQFYPLLENDIMCVNKPEVLNESRLEGPNPLAWCPSQDYQISPLQKSPIIIPQCITTMLSFLAGFIGD